MNDQELDNIFKSLTGTDTITLGNGGPYITSSNDNWSWKDFTVKSAPIQTPLKVIGDAEIDGQLKVGGKNIGELLDKIEQRLAILTPNSELEAKWEQLKELGERYRELEKDILEKEAIYKTLSR